LFTEWIRAAATVAAPENYDDLKFQLAHGQNPWWVWLAIRGLPGMEPLDSVVDEAWHRTTAKKDSYEWKSLAAVAAHYGHLDALAGVARNVKNEYDYWQPFQDLTGFTGSREDALSWWERNKDGLAFDRTKRVYVRK
jgi:hypothetical protein